MKKTFGIIGAGNMAEAFVGGVLASKLFKASDVCVSDVNDQRLEFMAATYGVRTESDNAALFNGNDIIILAVKPQLMGQILSQIAPGPDHELANRKLIVSIAAGIRIEKIEAVLYESLVPEKRSLLPIIRVMPNTPALVLKGVSGMSGNRYASPEDIQNARDILSALGTVAVFDESDLDAVTALSGSGPAYVFFLAEAMIQAGVQLGLAPKDARDLAVGTIKGAAALMEARDESPELLRQNVTSPGGTTEAAFRVMDNHNTREVIIDAIQVAADRSRELSQ
jgi:pyrroline-5-carboxylate reductase